MAAGQRTYSGGNFRFDVAGVDVGYLRKVSGGGMKADIAENKLGPDNVVKKHVAKIGWDEVKFEVGIGMGAACYKWIKAAFDKKFVTQQCTLVAGDFNHQAVQETQFIDCLVTSVATPKFDGGDKTACYFTVGMKPERVRYVPGDKKDIRSPIGGAQKHYLCSNFRLELSGLPCDRVATVDAMELKCGTATDDIGINRESTLHPTAVTVPDLKVSWSYADFTDIEKDARAWFVEGHHLEENEKHGRLVMLGPDMKEEIAEIILGNVGWKSFKGDDREGASDKLLRCSGEFYVETMSLNIKKYDA
jgi:hypothetical protein